MSKPGRKRKPGDRTPSGRLSRAGTPAKDYGSERRQAEMQWFAGNGDKALGSYPLGILKAQGQITDEQFDAAGKYARAYQAVAGRTSIAAAQWDERRGGREMPDDRLAKLEEFFHAATSALLKAPRRRKEVVDNLVVFGRMPRWLTPVRPRDGDVRNADELFAGLEVLASVEAGGARRERAA